MIPAAEAVICCEGYHDRAFWAGWLESLGCRSQRMAPDGRKVTGGQFGYGTPAGRFIRVIPCHGDDYVLRVAQQLLRERETRPLRHLVINLDADCGADDADGARPRLDAVAARVRQADRRAKRLDDGAWRLTDGTRVTAVLWTIDEQPADGVPGQQCLERLVCAALAEVYPERARAVHAWLAGRPDADDHGPKPHVWSFMAGWHADQGCDGFFRALWGNERLAEALRRRLAPVRPVIDALLG